MSEILEVYLSVGFSLQVVDCDAGHFMALDPQQIIEQLVNHIVNSGSKNKMRFHPVSDPSSIVYSYHPPKGRIIKKYIIIY